MTNKINYNLTSNSSCCTLIPAIPHKQQVNSGKHYAPQLVNHFSSHKTSSTNSILKTETFDNRASSNRCKSSFNSASNKTNLGSQQAAIETLQTSNNRYSVWQSPMACVQSLAFTATRESIEAIRQQLRDKNAKENQNQQITLVKDEVDKIATVCFKSAAKNAISAKMMCDFTDILDELYQWNEGKGVLICGHNGFFCSGGDLISVRELANYEGGEKMATLMQYNMTRLQALPMITMALVEGKALGGGAEIASTVDLRAMASSAKIGYVHVRVGICSAWGGGSRLVQLVGPSRAIELMSSGRLVGAQEALMMGLANHVINEPENNNTEHTTTTTNTTTGNGTSKQAENVIDETESFVLASAKQYLRQHVLGAKSTIMAIKALINAARTMPLEQALAAEAQILASTWGKPPHIEALNNNVKHKS